MLTVSRTNCETMLICFILGGQAAPSLRIYFAAKALARRLLLQARINHAQLVSCTCNPTHVTDFRGIADDYGTNLLSVQLRMHTFFVVNMLRIPVLSRRVFSSYSH